MRAFFSPDFMPSIHYSSFDAGPAVTASDEEIDDPSLRGFLDQTRHVLVGVNAVLERALTERYSIALEGVHLVPGLVPARLEGAILVQCVLAISDEEEHARHFWVRDGASEGLRPVEKYLRALPAIRHIQDHFVERARKAGVQVIESSELEEAVDAVIDLVVAEVELARTAVRATTREAATATRSRPSPSGPRSRAAGGSAVVTSRARRRLPRAACAPRSTRSRSRGASSSAPKTKATRSRWEPSSARAGRRSTSPSIHSRVAASSRAATTAPWR
jgi:hypothetical protein